MLLMVEINAYGNYPQQQTDGRLEVKPTKASLMLWLTSGVYDEMYLLQ
jgi:hypothetical protein